MWPSLDNPGMAKLLGNPGILGQGGGGHVCGHPWTIPGRLSYLGTWEIPSHVSASLDITQNEEEEVVEEGEEEEEEEEVKDKEDKDDDDNEEIEEEEVVGGEGAIVVEEEEKEGKEEENRKN